MDKQLDKRLVETFLKTLEAMITFRYSVYELLLSELGGYIWAEASKRVDEGQATGEAI